MLFEPDWQLAIYDGELPIKFQHNQVTLSNYLAQTRLGCDLKLEAIILQTFIYADMYVKTRYL